MRCTCGSTMRDEHEVYHASQNSNRPKYRVTYYRCLCGRTITPPVEWQRQHRKG